MRKVKPYIILLIVISLILAGLTGCTKMSAQEVIYRASAATMEIESFHMTMTVTGPGDYIVSAEGDYMSPDRHILRRTSRAVRSTKCAV